MKSVKDWFTLEDAAAELTCSQDDVIQAGIVGRISVYAQVQNFLDSNGFYFVRIQHNPYEKEIRKYGLSVIRIARWQLLHFIPGEDHASIDKFEGVIRPYHPEGEEMLPGAPTDAKGNRIKLVIRRSKLLIPALDLWRLKDELGKQKKSELEIERGPVTIENVTDLRQSTSKRTTTGLEIVCEDGDTLLKGFAEMERELGVPLRTLKSWREKFKSDFPAKKFGGSANAPVCGCLSVLNSWIDEQTVKGTIAPIRPKK